MSSTIKKINPESRSSPSYALLVLNVCKTITPVHITIYYNMIGTIIINVIRNLRPKIVTILTCRSFVNFFFKKKKHLHWISKTRKKLRGEIDITAIDIPTIIMGVIVSLNGLSITLKILCRYNIIIVCNFSIDCLRYIVLKGWHETILSATCTIW